MVANLPALFSLGVFVGVILLIMSEKIHLTIAAFLGALILVFTHVITLKEGIDYISQSYATLALFFGVMVLVRSFEPTKIFEYLATQMVLLAKGSGKLLMLGVIAITTPICAVLPNATTVMLLAPLIPPLAQEIGVDFVPILILMVFVANSAGLLTLVGDPATFIVGDAINISFNDYLFKLSFMGVLAIVSIVVITPFFVPTYLAQSFHSFRGFTPSSNQPPEGINGGGGYYHFSADFFRYWRKSARSYSAGLSSFDGSLFGITPR